MWSLKSLTGGALSVFLSNPNPYLNPNSNGTLETLANNLLTLCKEAIGSSVLSASLHIFLLCPTLFAIGLNLVISRTFVVFFGV